MKLSSLWMALGFLTLAGCGGNGDSSTGTRSGTLLIAPLALDADALMEISGNRQILSVLVPLESSGDAGVTLPKSVSVRAFPDAPSGTPTLLVQAKDKLINKVVDGEKTFAQVAFSVQSLSGDTVIQQEEFNQILQRIQSGTAFMTVEWADKSEAAVPGTIGGKIADSEVDVDGGVKLQPIQQTKLPLYIQLNPRNDGSQISKNFKLEFKSEFRFDLVSGKTAPSLARADLQAYEGDKVLSDLHLIRQTSDGSDAFELGGSLETGIPSDQEPLFRSLRIFAFAAPRGKLRLRLTFSLPAGKIVDVPVIAASPLP